MNSAFLFPGQASQYVGMGHSLYESEPIAKTFFDRANLSLPFDLTEVCFEGPEEDLKQTRITQPAIFVHSVAMAMVLISKGITPSAVAGHSLGEYSGLVAAGTMPFDDALSLVALRGELMQNAGDERPGTMAAVIGLDTEKIEELCGAASTDTEVVVPANFNAPGQIVISGDVEAVNRGMELAKEAGAKMVVPLVVSGAFHSPLMAPAAEKLAEKLESISFRPPNVPVYLNVTGESSRNDYEIREKLVQQLTHPVRWEESIRNMMKSGISEFSEIGPGKVLRGLVKRVDRKSKLYGFDGASDLAAI